MKKLKDYYEILGTTSKVSQKEIKRAYFEMAKQFHPDTVSDPSLREEFHYKFMLIKEAYQILSDKELRIEYDSHYSVYVSQPATVGQSIQTPADSTEDTKTRPPMVSEEFRKEKIVFSKPMTPSLRQQPAGAESVSSPPPKHAAKKSVPSPTAYSSQDVVPEDLNEIRGVSMQEIYQQKYTDSVALPEEVLQKANKLIADKNFAGAAEALTRAALKYPDNPDLLRTLGIAYTRLKRYKLGISALSKAILLEPQNYLNYLATGALHELDYDLEKAEYFYKIAEEKANESGSSDPAITTSLKRISQKYRHITHQKVSLPTIILTGIALLLFLYMIYMTYYGPHS